MKLTVFVLLTRLTFIGIIVTLLRDIPEPSRDVSLHHWMAESPRMHLYSPMFVQYPPLLGLAEALSYRPWSALGFSPPTALRLGAMLWDVAAGWFTLGVVAHVEPQRLRRAAVLYGLLPFTWISSVGAAQDEAVAAAFIAGSLWCLVEGRRPAARGTAVLGLFAAKVLVAPVLLAMVVARPRPERRREALRVGAWIGITMVVLHLYTGRNGLTDQVLFRPTWFAFSITPWGSLVEAGVLTTSVAWRVSQLLTLAGIASILVVFRHAETDGDPGEPGRTDHSTAVVAIRCTAVVFLTCFACLALVNAEYITVAAPPIVMAAHGRGDEGWLAAVAFVPWLTDATFSLSLRNGGTTEALLGTGASIATQPLEMVHLALCGVTSALLITMTRRIARPSRNQVSSGAVEDVSR